jgi:hypothetical protein
LEQSLYGAQARVRVLVLGLSAILLFLAAVGLFLYLKPGGSSDPTLEELPVFVAGPVDGFEPGSVSYFVLEHVYIVRMMDEAFLALYDLGPSGQAAVKQGDEAALEECRVQFIDDENGLTNLGTPPQGFEGKVFWEPCRGNVWDAAGRLLTGPADGDLDRFPLGVVDGIVQVDVSNRRCMNPVSQAAPCLPTQ